MSMQSFIKSREFLIILAVGVQVFIYVPYFFETPEPIQAIESSLLTISVIIATFALLVGLYTVTRRELLIVSRRKSGWSFSAWQVSLIWFMILTGVFLGQDSGLFTFFSISVVVPGDATIYSMILFTLISAGARSFRAKDIESVLFMGVTFLVLLQQAPVAAMVWSGFEPIGSWIVNNLGMSVSRTFALVVALGGIVLAVRFITGKEMGMVGISKEGGNE